MKLALLAVIALAMTAFAADRYASFAELARENTEGRDFRVIVRPTLSELGVLAIHGGRIETGTSEIAKAVAGEEHGYYLFEGIRLKNNFELHITSNNFDEPRALKFVDQTSKCISIHGYADDTESAVCVGGDNTELGKKISDAILSVNENWMVELPCAAFDGTGPENIVNKCTEAGVQLELSKKLRLELLESEEKMHKFARAINSVLQ